MSTLDPRGGCPRGFPEELLSGRLDGELTQGEDQRVRIHLEDCAACRQTYEELCELREASMTTPFPSPPDEPWDERPRSAGSGLLRGAGWGLLIVWLVAVTAFGLWQWLTHPATPWERFLAFAGVSGFALLFLSVLLDRLRAAKTDRYRRVEK